jgi:hypothetical protein
MNYELHIKCSRLDTPYLQASFLPASTFGWIEKRYADRTHSRSPRLLLSHLTHMLARFIYQNFGHFFHNSCRRKTEPKLIRALSLVCIVFRQPKHSYFYTHDLELTPTLGLEPGCVINQRQLAFI